MGCLCWRRIPLLLFAVALAPLVASAPASPETALDSTELNEVAVESMKRILPSQRALEEVGVTFLDALIKAGQIEMAKGAFETQLKVLKKVQPDQYKKYKDIPISRLAADAVFEQAQQAHGQPRTGNRLIDMLHENGIPIGSSLKGIQQAIKTQKEIEETDPAEQVAKAVFEKFQKQILPGLVANVIAGRNPFQMPQRPEMQQMMANQQRMFKTQHEEAMKQLQTQQLSALGKVQGEQFDLRPILGHMTPGKNQVRRMPEKGSEETETEYEEETTASSKEETEESEAEGAGNEGEEESEMENDEQEETENTQSRRRHRRHRRGVDASQTTRFRRQTRLGDGEDEDDEADARATSLADRAEFKMGRKAALLFGVYDQFPDIVQEEPKKELRKQSNKIPIELAEKVLRSEKLRSLLTNEELAYKLTDPEDFLIPKKLMQEPNPRPGFVTPRPIPERPRKMLPLLIGVERESVHIPELAPGLASSENGNNSNEYDENDDSEGENESRYKKGKKEEEDDATNDKPPPEPFRRQSPRVSAADSMVFGAHAEHGPHTRTLDNLMNNPGIAPILQNDDLIRKLSRPSVLTDSQRMGAGQPEKQRIINPRMHGIKTLDGKEMPPNADDMRVKQVVEEREIPPLFYIPQGRHTRLRWTGATEKEIPGLGTRLVLPSLDPTMPAINSAISTQGKQRDEYDSTFRIPNYWTPGDIFGIEAKTVQERLIGGDGNVDFPAMQAGMTFG